MEKRQIQARLIEHGSNFRQFAINHGYEPRTVTQVVQRWAGHDKLPRGRLSFRILRDLSRAIGKEVVPGILADSKEQTALKAV
ncbi:phage-associated protein, BcepMu gp16 family [Pseudomonas brassicacearum]|uniref:phage-associated protein, BcepMu gp16 family n=1 Tax=Pseudomonas brassicacearum TaxID=930166 RepID=UPI0006404021|nr:phage-associated protein, BcepMu gp16 family [Pseudomonas brassicacearum]